jgi:FMN reductase
MLQPMTPTVAVVVGNPKPESRTLAAAERAATLLGAPPSLTVDLARLSAGLLDPADATVQSLVDEVLSHDVLLFASPTYHGTYTGLLKAFLDRLGYRGLHGRVAVPLMVGAGPGHAFAPHVLLRQVLVELGATVVEPLYVLESAYEDESAYADWARTARALVDAGVHAVATVSR